MKAIAYIIIIALVVSAVSLSAPGTASTTAPAAPPASSTGNGAAMVYFAVNGTGLSPSDKVEFAFTDTHITQKVANQWYFEINQSMQEVLYFEPNQSMTISITSLSSLPILYVNMSARSSIEVNSTLFHGDVKTVSLSIPIINVSDPNGGQIPVGGNTSITVTIGKPFTPAVHYYKVTFDESGLPAGTTWGIGKEAGGTQSFITSSTDTSITIGMSNGTYTFLIGVVSSGHSTGNYTANTSQITITVNGANLVFHIKFTANPPFFGLTQADIGALLLAIGAIAAVLAVKSKGRGKRIKKIRGKGRQPALSDDIISGQQEHSQEGRDGDQGRPPDQADQPGEPEEEQGEDMEREETDEFSKHIKGGSK